MDINFTLVAQAVAFFVLIVFTIKFVWPPLLTAIETRQKEIADGLAAGEKGKRLALPHSRIMIHQPMGGAQGQASDIEVEAQQILRIRKSLTEDYAQMTGRPYEKVLQDMDRDNFMSSYEAVEYGLIDRVIEGKSN